MESNAQQPTNVCTICQKPATKFCSSCKDTPAYDDTKKSDSTYYCSSECQKADWKNHLPVCRRLRDRKALYNAGNVLQGIFYRYREKVFDKVIVKIEKTGGKLVIFEGLYKPSTTEYDILEPFPVELCQDADDKKAFLVYGAGDDAVAWMHDVIEYVLSGLAASLEEHRVHPKDNTRYVICVNAAGTLVKDKEHKVLKVTLKHGKEQYVLDLCGAQFGCFQPVMPLREYVDSHVQHVESQHWHFGATMDGLLEICKENTIEGRVMRLNKKAHWSLQATLERWEEKKDMTVKQLLALPPPKCDLETANILIRMDLALDRMLVQLKAWHYKLLRDIKAGKITIEQAIEEDED